ncbi:MAG: hypothetical protein ACE5KT_06315 [Methanosarcinales archaeon]
MAHPIEPTETLEGEDAREFLKNIKKHKPSKEEWKFVLDSIKLYKEHPF